MPNHGLIGRALVRVCEMIERAVNRTIFGREHVRQQKNEAATTRRDRKLIPRPPWLSLILFIPVRRLLNEFFIFVQAFPGLNLRDFSVTRLSHVCRANSKYTICRL